MKFSLKYILAAALIATTWRSAGQTPDSVAVQALPVIDSAMVQPVPATGPAPADSTRPKPKPFLTHPIEGTSQDSLVFDVKNDRVYIYNQGNVTYDNMNLKADRIRLNTDSRVVEAKGAPPASDSLGRLSRPVFIMDGQTYDMDSLRFNLESKVGIILNSTTKQGEGFMIAGRAKVHPDKTTDAENNRYTTCNRTSHPHFYIRMSRSRVVPNKKVIFGLSYFVLEDVPLYFPFLPFGFFPMMSGPTSGFIMPSFGEEYAKGFFLRDGGYYFRLSDHMDAQLTGSIFTLGSWDARLGSRYMKRYKYSGNLSFDYAMNVIGEKGSADYFRSPTYSLRWQHQQDPKLRPGTTFSASVNFTSSGYSKYSAQTLNDMLSTQTNSSISFTKNWRGGRGGFPGANVAVSLSHSQNSRDSSVMFTFPNASWSIPKFKPFKRRDAQGKERWYEKVSVNYSGATQASINTKEKYLGKPEMFDNLKTGIKHTVPVSATWSLLGYINVTPNATFNDNMYFQRIDRRWDDEQQRVVSDTTGGFWNAYDYNVSASMSTKVYGLFQMKNTQGWLRAVRHVLTPTASLTYRPDFSTKYRSTYQTNAEGATSTYSPFDGQMYGVPGGAKSATLSFGLQQNLEAKVKDGDTVRIMKIVDNLNIASSYNFVAKEFNLSNFRVSFSNPIYKQYTLRVDADFDPYALDSKGNRVNKILMVYGKMPRLIRASTSFGWQLNKSLGYGQTINDTGVQPAMLTDREIEMMDPVSRENYEMEQRRMLGGTYYDFSIPYNLSVNYSLSYNNNGKSRIVTQTMSFGGSITLTPYQSDGNNRWGINFQGGYDFQMRRPTLGNIAIVRDLHCFVMSLNWIPIGMQRSWAFNIRVKASVLQDLKYDKNRSMYDNSFD
jgi:hypothetical protein